MKNPIPKQARLLIKAWYARVFAVSMLVYFLPSFILRASEDADFNQKIHGVEVWKIAAVILVMVAIELAEYLFERAAEWKADRAAIMAG